MAVSDNQCSSNDEEELEGVGGDENPALASSQETVESCEEEGSDAERCDGRDCFDPADTFRWGDDTETKVNGVS